MGGRLPRAHAAGAPASSDRASRNASGMAAERAWPSSMVAQTRASMPSKTRRDLAVAAIVDAEAAPAPMRDLGLDRHLIVERRAAPCSAPRPRPPARRRRIFRGSRGGRSRPRASAHGSPGPSSGSSSRCEPCRPDRTRPRRRVSAVLRPSRPRPAAPPRGRDTLYHCFRGRRIAKKGGPGPPMTKRPRSGKEARAKKRRGSAARRAAGARPARRHPRRRPDDRADGPLRDPDPRRLRRRRDQGRAARRRHHAARRPDAEPAHGADVLPGQPQQAQRRARHQDAGRPRRAQAPVPARRRVHLQRAPGGAAPARPRAGRHPRRQPAARASEPDRLRRGRALLGPARLRRPDPGPRRHSGDHPPAGRQGRAALCAAHHGGPHRRAQRRACGAGGADGARALRQGPDDRAADVRDAGAVRAVRPFRRPRVRAADRPARLQPPARARPPPLRDARRPHLHPGLHRPALGGVLPHHRQARAVPRRSLPQCGRALALFRRGLRADGRGAGDAHHRRMAGHLPGGRHSGRADARPRRADRRSASRGGRLLRDARPSDRGPHPRGRHPEPLEPFAARDRAPSARPGRAHAPRCCARPG